MFIELTLANSPYFTSRCIQSYTYFVYILRLASLKLACLFRASLVKVGISELSPQAKRPPRSTEIMTETEDLHG